MYLEFHSGMWIPELSELFLPEELRFLREKWHFRGLSSVPQFQNCRKGPHCLLMTASFALLPRACNIELQIAV